MSCTILASPELAAPHIDITGHQSTTRTSPGLTKPHGHHRTSQHYTDITLRHSTRPTSPDLTAPPDIAGPHGITQTSPDLDMIRFPRGITCKETEYKLHFIQYVELTFSAFSQSIFHHTLSSFWMVESLSGVRMSVLYSCFSPPCPQQFMHVSHVRSDYSRVKSSIGFCHCSCMEHGDKLNTLCAGNVITGVRICSYTPII